MNEATETMDVVKDAATTTEAPSRPPTGGARHEAHQQSRTASEKGSSSSSTSSPPAAPSTGQQQEKHTEDEKQEKITRSTDDEYPEGGTRAWLVAAGTAGILFCSLGYTNSFGVFQAYYMRNQLRDHTPDDISWIGSIQAFLVFASGAIGGPVFDRYGAWVIRPAAVVYIFSVMMTSLCREYWQFMLAQGVLSGISNGLIMFPAMAATPQYFLKRRGAAMGLVIAGSSVGAVVFPIVLSELLETVGFGWSVRVCGFIMMPVLLFSSMTVRARLPPRKSRFFVWTAFRDPLYLCLIGGVCLMFVGMFIPLFYLPTFGIDHGMNPALASYLVAIINGASVPGRIVPGILGDKFGRINTLFTAGLLTGVLILVWPKAGNEAGIIGFSAAYGLTSGAIISGGSVVFTLCPKSPKDIGTYMGMGIAFASMAVLVGPPVSGALLNRYHGYDQISIFGGVVCMAGTVLALCAKMFTNEGLLGFV
ncbi:Riboflavin transporter MCH5 [Colletotrichum higginsianum IMI 349063]|uniref:Riboflavin transporter MCH5 n=2 Tax=Colletotrichum higginsianum TaxID=80884 RepID=A0A1B7XXP3_COLHI|nr:Riboflavin transporter MCH5 [Colletotrichum higginsianum IMI 349063]OBR04514.1 Riboflavin transporter MCH5 [Colletotrichum higginsianum IMI 349063]TIC89763.1 Riboflavin transporter MCH5 [Colletotrichum higginsianum]GJC99151.1 riboflavin transporter MCH5 [Colletotrichum higginsianum]